MSGIAATIFRFVTGTYTVKRRGAVGYERGVAVVEAPSTFEIQASVQPLGGRELMRLPEGDRERERRLVFTVDALDVTGGGGSKADVIVIDGEDWEVTNVEAWPTFGFFKATVTRVRR